MQMWEQNNFADTSSYNRNKPRPELNCYLWMVLTDLPLNIGLKFYRSKYFFTKSYISPTELPSAFVGDKEGTRGLSQTVRFLSNVK